MTQTDYVTDRHHLTRATYATNAALEVRIRTHERYTVPKIDFAEWVLELIPWRGGEVVLDLGCGSGLYRAPLLARIGRHGRLVSADLSFGMLQQLAARSPAEPNRRLNADAMNLPLPSDSLDVVLANHVLYHLPDIGRGVAEIHRVLRPGGARPGPRLRR
jgi:ubiquinone/menaquinone biosynthesis C-methylase UbiE